MGTRAPIRYQGAIVSDGAAGPEVLLIRHLHPSDGRTYWLLPGGGMEADETPEACVARELVEETGVTVRVDRLVMDVPSSGPFYDREHRFLCLPLGGDAARGVAPEFVTERPYDIVEVGWFALTDESAWGNVIHSDRITLANLRGLRRALAST